MIFVNLYEENQMSDLHQSVDEKRAPAAREAQRLAFELTAGLLAVQVIQGLRALRAGYGVAYG